MISMNWIKDYIDYGDTDLKEIATKVTNAGINVEKISKQVDATNLVIGHTLSREDHINSDHLNVLKVDLGDEIVGIVCGAHNVDANQKVIVSKVGAVLPGGIQIKQSEIRGVESNGMICALVELGLPDDGKDEIHVLPDDAPVGGDPLKYMGLDDTLYTLDLNPNRNDCKNHIPFAYEVGAVLNKKVKMPEVTYNETTESIKDEFDLKIETENCLMYLAKLAKNVTIKESPEFIKNRLNAAGMRSINNVVDISNYIMLEYGQPLHFFDADKLGKHHGVRMAKDGEKLITLDGEERKLNNTDILVTNEEKIVCIAGVMGSMNSEVDEDTKNILIESAIFKPYNVRYTSLRLDLRSEASLRFEKGINYEYTILALKRACHLLEKYADAKICKEELVHDKIEKNEKIVDITLSKINKIMGINIPLEDAKDAFDRLEFPYILKDETFTVTIPNRRLDVNLCEDLIEEVGRIYGFDHIEAVSPVLEVKPGNYSPKVKFRKDISKYMRSLGLNEIRTYNLIKEDEAVKYNYDSKEIIKLLRPISKDKTHLRSSMIPSLLNVFKYNNARGVKDINIYETSNVYYKENNSYLEEVKLAFLITGNLTENTWQHNNLNADFYLIKGMIENLFKYLGFDRRYRLNTKNLPTFLHPGISATINVDNETVGFIGKIHPSILKDDIYVCEISLEKLFTKKTSKLKFSEPNKYPSVKRDVAFLFNKDIIVEDIIKEINRNGSKILSKVDVFDVYELDEKKSIAFSLIFEDKTKTLTEEEINNAFNNIITKISSKFKAELRNK